jgi:hypothetical protein
VIRQKVIGEVVFVFAEPPDLRQCETADSRTGEAGFERWHVFGPDDGDDVLEVHDYLQMLHDRRFVGACDGRRWTRDGKAGRQPPRKVRGSIAQAAVKDGVWRIGRDGRPVRRWSDCGHP